MNVRIVRYNIFITLTNHQTYLRHTKHTTSSTVPFTCGSSSKRIYFDLISHRSHLLGLIQPQCVIHTPPWPDPPLTHSPQECIIYLNIYWSCLMMSKGSMDTEWPHTSLLLILLFWIYLKYLGYFLVVQYLLRLCLHFNSFIYPDLSLQHTSLTYDPMLHSLISRFPQIP